MEKQFITKITKIQTELKVKNILKATDFDKIEEVAKMLDAQGSTWNKFIHKQCEVYGFEVWKKLNNNFYVKATAEGKNEAEKQGLTPHTNAEILRGKIRK